jgi:hypothetical protein
MNAYAKGNQRIVQDARYAFAERIELFFDLFLEHAGRQYLSDTIGDQKMGEVFVLIARLLHFSEYSKVMQNRRSVAGNRNLRRKIFDIRRAALFSSTVSLYRPLWGFHRPPTESLAGNPNIRRHNRCASCETNSVHALEIV